MSQEGFLAQAVLHNLRSVEGKREWIDLEDSLRGPAHVAKLLIRRAQDKRSTPEKPYRFNAEQLACVALFVQKLEEGFARREDVSKPWIKPAEVLMTIILDGGGGCGKTTLALEVLFPLMEAFFGIAGVLRRAPSNKPARLILGRTMHSSQGLTPQDSMRTHALALNAQSRQKLATTHVEAGVLYIDEYSQLQSELHHASALRTTYARETAYGLDKARYYAPRERFGCMAIPGYSGDHLQLPPVPESSSLLAPLEGVTNEHKVGASIFRNAELVFQFLKAMRFSDADQIAILETMRTPGGKALRSDLWEALQRTELGAAHQSYSPGGITPVIAGASPQCPP